MRYQLTGANIVIQNLNSFHWFVVLEISSTFEIFKQP